MQVQPYLFFEGRCEEALDFYRDALGAEVTHMMRYSDMPQGEACPGGSPPADEIMHANITVGDTAFMASDGMAGGSPEFRGFSLSVTAKDDAEAKRLFSALSQGGQEQMPMGPTFFASSFGMVADRFGVSWMVITPLPDHQ